MKHKTILAVGLAGLVTMTLMLSGVVPAGADYAPQPGDVVGVGGDTPQYTLTFLANGDTAGDLGFNAAGAYHRLVTFNATADGNGRSAYAQGSTEAAPIPLNPTDVLRAGTSPVQRVQSSGAALTALLADTNEHINFVFSASLPSPAQQTAAKTKGWAGLHVVELGTDSVQMAADTTTNAPSGLSVTELVAIYHGTDTKWNQLPGNSSGSSDTIIPEIPPSTSSIYKTFIANLKTANGGVTVTLGADVKTVEQNDPTAVTHASTPADAIVPFSQARLNLYNSGYFYTPSVKYPGAGSPIAAGIQLLSGTPGDAQPVYSAPITDYVIFRQNALTSTTVATFEPGSTLNWARALFADPSGPHPYVDTAAGQALITASGVTPDYKTLGLDHT